MSNMSSLLTVIALAFFIAGHAVDARPPPAISADSAPPYAPPGPPPPPPPRRHNKIIVAGLPVDAPPVYPPLPPPADLASLLQWCYVGFMGFSIVAYYTGSDLFLK